MEAREEGDWDEGRSKKSSLSSPLFLGFQAVSLSGLGVRRMGKVGYHSFCTNNVRWQWDNISS